MGRSAHMTWGLTAAIVDNSDLWEEQLNKKRDRYFVDGEWRKLKITGEYIKVKQANGKIKDKKISIKMTHRGPLIRADQLRFNAALLFGGNVPNLPVTDQVTKDGKSLDTTYSFGWGGAFYEGDTSLDFLDSVMTATDVPEFFEMMQDATH